METCRPGFCGVPFVTRLMRLLEARGLDPYAVAAQAGLNPAALRLPGSMLPIANAIEMHAVAKELLHDPHVGLYASDHGDLSAVGTLGFIITNHPTMREGLDEVWSLSTSLTPELVTSAEDTASGRIYRMHIDVRGAVRGQDACLTELICTSLRVAQAVSGPWVSPRVDLPGPAVDVGPFVERLGVVPTFGHTIGAFVVPTEVLELRFPQADPVLRVHMREAVEQQVRSRREAAGMGHTLVRLLSGTLDVGLAEFRGAHGRVPLTEREHQLLSYFAAHRNEVVTHAMLEHDVWSLSRDEMSFAPAVAIRRVRQKIETDPTRPVNLVTVFGAGWKLVAS